MPGHSAHPILLASRATRRSTGAHFAADQQQRLWRDEWYFTCNRDKDSVRVLTEIAVMPEQGRHACWIPSADQRLLGSAANGALSEEILRWCAILYEMLLANGLGMIDAFVSCYPFFR